MIDKIYRLISKELHRIELIFIDDVKKKIEITLNDNILKLDCYKELIEVIPDYNLKIKVKGNSSFIEHI